MKLFKKKPEPIMIDRSKLTIEGILELSRQKPGIVFSQSVFLELLRQLDKRIENLEKKPTVRYKPKAKSIIRR